MKGPQEVQLHLKTRAAVRSDQNVQTFIYKGFEDLQGCRLHSLSRRSVPMLHCPHLLMVNNKQAKKIVRRNGYAHRHFVGDNLVCPLADIHKVLFSK